jgi:hypothetical protein
MLKLRARTINVSHYSEAQFEEDLRLVGAPQNLPRLVVAVGTPLLVTECTRNRGSATGAVPA